MVFKKMGLIDNFLVLLVLILLSNILLFSNMLKATPCIILYRNQNKISVIFLYVFLFSFLSLSNLIYIKT